MALRRKVPRGPAIRWTEENEEAEADPTPAHIAQWTQEVINGWMKYARIHLDLINAEVKDDGP